MCHRRLRAMCNAMPKRASRRRIDSRLGSREISRISEKILRTFTYEIEKVPLASSLEREVWRMGPTSYLHPANDHG